MAEELPYKRQKLDGGLGSRDNPPPSDTDSSELGSARDDESLSSVVSEVGLSWWKDNGGDILEPALESLGPAGGNSNAPLIALLSAQWLIQFATSDNAVLSRRQDLPAHAFLTLQDLQRLTNWDSLPIICLSYMWLTPKHPDPRGDTLRLVGKALHAYCGTREYGVFWDFCSLFQHDRTEEEQKLFKKSLQYLAHFYAHENTIVFRVTQFPPDYPDAYGIPQDSVTMYSIRGWPFAESIFSSFSSHEIAASSLDISNYKPADNDDVGEYETRYKLLVKCKVQQGTLAPLLPATFRYQLGQKTFSNGRADRDLVADVYDDYFRESFCQRRGFVFRTLGWGDSEVEKLAEIITNCNLPSLEAIILDGNKIGARGLRALNRALCRAMSDGRVSRLSSLTLHGNITDDEVTYAELAESMCSLKIVWLSKCGITERGCKALVQALLEWSKKLRLEKLYLTSNDIGCEGEKALVRLSRRCPNLYRIEIDSDRQNAAKIIKTNGEVQYEYPVYRSDQEEDEW